MPANSSNPAARGIVLAVWAGIVVLGAGWLRLADLDRLPFHADESATGAQTLAYRLESASYEFDPAHFHGPLLTALAEPWCRFKGETSWRELREVTLRQVVAACGLLTVVGILFLGTEFPRSLVAMGLAATSPLLVYFSRIFIHEPMFLFFAIPAFYGLMGLPAGRCRWISAIALGIGIGGMAATRETVVVSLFAWGVTGVLYAWRLNSSTGDAREFASDLVARTWKPLLLAAILTLGVIYWFYTAGGRQPSGFIGFFSTYFEYKAGEGHEKPFAYYLELLVLPKHLIGRWWSEAGILFLALCVYLERREKSPATAAAGRFFFEAGILHLLVFSVISYKTPWLVCLGWLHLCIAGGYGAVALVERFTGWRRLIPALGVLAITAWHGVQAKRAAFRFAADGRNPYAYVATSIDVTKLPAFIAAVRDAMPESREHPVAVVGEQYWPLPWYLREEGSIGYWERLPEKFFELPLILVLPSALEELTDELGDTHMFIPRGLRDEFPVMVAVRNDLWEAYQAR